MSDAVHGTVIRQVAPEAAEGRPPALAQNGDWIGGNGAARRLLNHLSEPVRRGEGFVPVLPPIAGGGQHLCGVHLDQADPGCGADCAEDSRAPTRQRARH